MIKKVLISAGGTGGHVFPGIAIAQALQQRSIAVHWLGTQHGLDAQLVPREKIAFSSIAIKGLRGKSKVSLLLAPIKIFFATLSAINIIRRENPDVVLTLGGYVTGPAGIAAWLLRKPLVLHEQNAIAGMTNKMLYRFASRVLEAFPHTFSDAKKVITVGNPIRQVIIDIPSPEQRLAQRQGALRVLVIGGSQGAQALNALIPHLKASLQDKIDIWHQTGAKHFVATQQYYRHVKQTVKLVQFIDNMAQAYEWADIIICRSGALTVSEVAAAGVASILVPFPSAVDDHQTANAHYLSNADAALLLPQASLNAEQLIGFLNKLWDNRALVLTMSKAARALAKPDSTQRVINILTAINQQ